MARDIGGDRSDKDKPEIKVVDRRAFTSEGRRREDEPDAPAGETGDPGSSEEPRGPRRPSGAEEPPENVRGPGFVMEEDRTTPQDRADRDAAFINLCISIFESGVIHLGMNREGESTGEGGKVDLEAARGAIAMLEMLKRKTAGNLSEEESKILESLLADLQMAYVMKAPGASS